MLQAANTDLFNNPLVPKAHSSQCQNLPYPIIQFQLSQYLHIQLLHITYPILTYYISNYYILHT